MMNNDFQAKQTKILVVCDTPESLNLLWDLGEFCVSFSMKGDHAVRMAEFNDPDLILIDIMTPRIDGFTTCIQLKKHEFLKNIPVVFLSALTNNDYKLIAYKAGGVDYISKPLRSDDLVARISAHLN